MNNRKEYRHNHYIKNKEHVLKLGSVWVENHREQVNEYARRWHAKHRIEINLYGRLRRKLDYIKLIWIVANKFPICNWCGESNVEALVLDHINGGGTKDVYNKSGNTKNRGSMYKYYLKHIDVARETLQILCAKCNYLKQKNNSEYHCYRRNVV